MDELLCIRQAECWTEFGNVLEVEERCLTEVSDMWVKGKVRIHFDTQIIDRCGKGDILARESDTGDG